MGTPLNHHEFGGGALSRLSIFSFVDSLVVLRARERTEMEEATREEHEI